MKKHAMDCFVWAAQKAIATKDDEESQSRSDNSATEDESPAAKGVLLEEEKGEIRSLSLPALLTKQAPADNTTDEESADDAQGHCPCRSRAAVARLHKQAAARQFASQTPQAGARD